MYHKFAVRKKKKCFKCGYWNAAEAAFCNLCYEPFNKAAPKEGAAAPRPAAAPPAPKRPYAAAPLALLAAAGALFLFRAFGPSGNPAPQAAGQVNRFVEKTAAADKLLADYVAAKEALLAEIAAAPPNPEAFGIAGPYTAKLFGIEEDYSLGIEALKLPGPGETDKVKDAFYLEWLEIHRHKETVSMRDFSERYQRLIEKAGVSAGN